MKSRTKPQDEVLDKKIGRLKLEIETWARRRDLWHDSGFFDYTERVRPIEWDETGYLLVLASDGPIAESVICAGNEDGTPAAEFEGILRKRGFWYENYDGGEMWIYATDSYYKRDFKEYMRWRWICSLIKPEFDILNEELYAYLGRRPNRLAALHWRDYERLLAALLESQGYDVELGPGHNDGGVDIKLLQRDPLGDIMTLVQAKCYRPDRKIRLEAVQALHGVATADEVAKTMFITTSGYSASAERFAARKNVPMTLYTSENVRHWCEEASHGIVEDKRKLVTDDSIRQAFREARGSHEKMLHSSVGHTITANQFAVVLKETRTAALLLEVGARITDHDGHRQRGHEVPDADSIPVLSHVQRSAVRRARKIGERGERRFWDGRHFFSPWNGNPVYFDHCD